MSQTVFTTQELRLLFPLLKQRELQNKLYYAIQTGKIQTVRRGVYVKKKYNSFELANKLYTPSYISFETVLSKEGIIFQSESLIRVASYLTREITVDNHTISYRTIPKEVLTNAQGIQSITHASIATKERAFLDAVFLYKDYHFDSLRPLNWDVVKTLTPIYHTKAFQDRVNKYYQLYIEDHA